MGHGVLSCNRPQQPGSQQEATGQGILFVRQVKHFKLFLLIKIGIKHEVRPADAPRHRGICGEWCVQLAVRAALPARGSGTLTPRCASISHFVCVSIPESLSVCANNHAAPRPKRPYIGRRAGPACIRLTMHVGNHIFYTSNLDHFVRCRRQVLCGCADGEAGKEARDFPGAFRFSWWRHLHARIISLKYTHIQANQVYAVQVLHMHS